MHTHVAEIQDPLTGQIIQLEADTEAGLEALIDQHLHAAYPDPPTGG